MPNRLATSTSPYLRQHADNPVDWQPWDEAALSMARTSNKPILLSIGYSACHWCHVMAHESFENPQTAALMNALYVNIKVDREERPDLDKVYQLAHQALTGRGGGWPLTVFLTPDDHLPFYAGTYFPPEARHGMPPFSYVLQQVFDFWQSRREDVRKQNQSLLAFLDERNAPADNGASLDDAPLRRAYALFARHFDPANGGHVGGPKFPHCGESELLFEQPDSRNTAILGKTLEAMADRGLYDHLLGGFFRYCVDARWDIPHFEKMLYDNAQLLPLYARAAVAIDQRYAQIVEDSIGWLRREMQAPGSAFYATLDADSEGEEGLFYLWQRDDVAALLSADDFAVAERYYGLDRPPNFEGHAWHLHRAEDPDEITRLLRRNRTDVDASLGRSRQHLLDARSRRVRPGLDDKVLTAWNALLASGLFRAARYLGRDDYADLGVSILNFLERAVWIDGRLFACYAGQRAQFPAYLDDHAFLLDALIERLQCRWDARVLAFARQIAEALLQRFEDREHGGFFFTAHDHEALPHRPKPWLDESVPSGNGIAARALLRCGHLLGEPPYLAAAERTLRAAWPTLGELPHACAALLRALQDYLSPRAHLIVRAPADALTAWRAAFDPVRDARVDAYFIDAAESLPTAFPATTPELPQAAWLCVGTQCLAPVTEPRALRALLDAGV